MNRKAKILRYNTNGTRALAIDELNSESIVEFLQMNKKKFNYIADHILNNRGNRELYDREGINKDCNDVYAMKFFKNGSNERIYCKELKHDNVHVIVMSELYGKKKSRKNNKRIVNRLKSIGSIVYEIRK